MAILCHRRCRSVRCTSELFYFIFAAVILSSLTKAADSVGVGLRLQKDGGLLGLSFFVVAKPEPRNSHRILRDLPAYRYGGAVERFKMKNRSRRY